MILEAIIGTSGFGGLLAQVDKRRERLQRVATSWPARTVRAGRPLNELVDCMLFKPFAQLGHGSDGWWLSRNHDERLGWSCLGVHLELLWHVKGIDLEDPFIGRLDPAKLRRLARAFEKVEDFHPKDSPGYREARGARYGSLDSLGLRPLDALWWTEEQDLAHVATVEDKDWVVSTNYLCGWVERMPMNEAVRFAKSAWRVREPLPEIQDHVPGHIRLAEVHSCFEIRERLIRWQPGLTFEQLSPSFTGTIGILERPGGPPSAVTLAEAPALEVPDGAVLTRFAWPLDEPKLADCVAR